jgi:hypothetical protein
VHYASYHLHVGMTAPAREAQRVPGTFVNRPNVL